MANYPAEVPLVTGTAPTARTPVNGDTIPGGVILIVRNANASPCVVTIVTPGLVQGDLAIADRTVSVPATTGERWIDIPNDSVYVDPATGLVTLSTFSVTATVTYYVLRKSS